MGNDGMGNDGGGSNPKRGWVHRRGFLTLTGSAATALLIGCGDDAIGGGGDTDSGTDTDGSGSTGTTSTTNSATGTTNPTGSTTSSTGPDGTGTSTETTDTAFDSSSGGPPNPPSCEEPQVIDFAPELVFEDAVMFPYAIMVGEMKPSSVMITAYVPAGQSKLLRIWQPGEAEGTVSLVHESVVQPNKDGFIKESIEGLCAGQWYRYAYFEGADDEFSARSPIAEFRTAIAEDAIEPLVLAVSGCAGDAYDWPSIDLMADEYYDAFIELGDMAYNDGSETLEEYRASWRPYMETADYKKALSRAGMYVTWDDHEIDDNSNFDRETMDPSELLRRQNAMDAFFELLPVDAEGPSYQLWRSFRWGLTAEIFVLDCRYERKPSQGLYMSPTQMAWLKEGLASSPCHFKIIMNSVPITNMPTQWDVAASDRWDGFQGQRNELATWINANAIENIWFLSGDFHVCFVSRLEPNSTNLFGNIREIAVSSGRVNPIPEFLLGLDGSQFDYGLAAARGLILTFDPVADEVNVRFIHPQTGDDDYNETLSWSP